jgi:hypothetical protein
MNFSTYYLNVRPKLLRFQGERKSSPGVSSPTSDVFRGTLRDFAKLHPPDLHFIRNALAMQVQVKETVPFLLGVDVFRVVFPVIRVDVPSPTGLILQTDLDFQR